MQWRQCNANVFMPSAPLSIKPLAALVSQRSDFGSATSTRNGQRSNRFRRTARNTPMRARTPD
eukprot:9168550-Alexandrium_andersonii.AAC.1